MTANRQRGHPSPKPAPISIFAGWLALALLAGGAGRHREIRSTEKSADTPDSIQVVTPDGELRCRLLSGRDPALISEADARVC
jgi:hypothetical protein